MLLNSYIYRIFDCCKAKKIVFKLKDNLLFYSLNFIDDIIDILLLKKIFQVCVTLKMMISILMKYLFLLSLITSFI